MELQETLRRRRSDGSVATELSEDGGGSLVSREDLESANQEVDRAFD